MAENTDFGLAIVKVLEKQCYMGRLLVHARGIPSLASLVPPSSALSLEMRSTPRRSCRFFCAVVHERRFYIQPSDHLNSGGKVDKGEHAPMFHA
jgi:hypothetical protein